MKYSYLGLGLICLSTLSFAKPDTKAKPLGAGFVQYPMAGVKTITLEEVPASIRHSAESTLAGYGAGYSLTGAQVDYDDVVAIFEIQATAADGRHLEVDVDQSGRIEELEVEVRAEEIPAVVMDALKKHAPDFVGAQEKPAYEKSVRPSKNGLLEVWYEFSGSSFDVEIRNDGKAILIEPA